jgi:hypothetical protein
VLPSPKRKVKGKTPELYEYYAGYSAEFVRATLDHVGGQPGSIVADPWNGAGTTTTVAAAKGFRAKGFDLNPAMVLVAKASHLDQNVRPSTLPLARDILRKAPALRVLASSEPLLRWFSPSAASRIRGIELAIQDILVPEEHRGALASHATLDGVSSLAAFYYTALFRTVRKLTNRFRPSNPTWISRANKPLGTSEAEITQLYEQEISGMEAALGESHDSKRLEVQLALSDSLSLPLHDGSVDIVLSSPPYCTRIDYAIATLPELAVLNASAEDIRKLRRALIGSPTLSEIVAKPEDDWGQKCLGFLASVQVHPSKGSKGYYCKVLSSYFHCLYGSLGEIRRITRLGGDVFLVVQDSHYKELHNDLPGIVREMASALHFDLIARTDFSMSNPMRNINTKSRGYRTATGLTESVLHLRAPGTLGAGARPCK